jgi:fibronectin-binding autotransporter adhesin
MKKERLAQTGLLLWGLIMTNVWTGYTQRQIENINRGLLAVKVSNGVYLSWRVLGHEYTNAGYNLYRESTKLNAEPITGASCFLDKDGTTGIGYSVAAVIDGIEQEKSAPVNAWGSNLRKIPIQRPAGGTTPDDVDYTYNANDISVGDLDGDGDYEIVLKWDPTNSHDNSHSGYTGNVYLDAYELNGTHLWRIDLGINIRAGAHYTQFMVYDLDGDGRAEVACKTADGTTDGIGTVIGDAEADYRNSAGRILSGPEFLTIFDGETGVALVTTGYIPARGNVSSWGDDYGNRVDRFLACIAYLDGQRPSLVMCRGYYTRTVLAAWDWRNDTLTSRWVFDTWNGYSSYEGQGNHNLSVADVDDDGKDEIIYGAMAVDDDGTGLWTTGLGHGDAMHVSDIDPNRPGLEKWGITESGSTSGSQLLDARTGEMIWGTAPGDIGRGVSADLVAAYPGMECWGGTVGLRRATGEYAGSYPSSSNFLVWWDGDELRELLDEVTVSKYGAGEIFQPTYCLSNNGTKANPCLSADLLGDWREEIIFRTVYSESLRLYVSTSMTNRRLYTLMHDPHYRLSIAWQNVAYNQPPHTSFFLGHNMSPPPPPPIINARLRWSSGSTWDLASKNWRHADSLTIFQDGDDVLFDLSGSNASAISLTGNLSPSQVYVHAPRDYVLDGPGSLTGTMDLMKAGSGTLTLNSDHDYSGETNIWQGTLFMNGSLDQSPAGVYNGASAGGSGTFGGGLTVHKNGALIIGPGKGIADTLRIMDSLLLETDTRICFDLSEDSSGIARPNDVLMIDSNLVLKGPGILDINLLDDTLQRGVYTLIHYTGSFLGGINLLSCNGLDGIPFRLRNSGNSIALDILKLRNSALVTWMGGLSNDWDVADQLNWLNAGVPDWFVPGDTVIFDDESVSNTVNLTSSIWIGGIRVEASGDYTMEGSGKLTGPGGITKSGSGNLVLSGEHTFTGPVHLLEGSLQIHGMKNGGLASFLGASSADPSNLVFNGGELRLTGPSSFSDRGITIESNGGILNLVLPSTDLTLSGNITGNGLLTRTGDGDLIITSSNDWTGGIHVKNGTLRLGSEEANISGLGTGKVILENASLDMLDNHNSYTDNCQWDLIVPEGSESWLRLDSRSSLVGSLEGSGTLNVWTPYIRSELMGDWSGFTGRIKVSTDADDALFLPASQHGFGNAAIELTDHVTMLYRKSENAVIRIGELAGTAGSQLGAGGEASHTITWIIGNRNTDAVFQGQITNRQFKNSGSVTSVVKEGTGNWNLTGNNTYSGITEIKGGILTITNAAGSATGAGDVYVRSQGELRGTGSINGKLFVEGLAWVTVGTGSGNGILTINNDAEFQDGSYLSVRLNPVDKTADKLVVEGDLRLGGTLIVTKSVEGSFIAGETYRILGAHSITIGLESIVPATPGEGLAWDTTWLASEGLLRIGKASTNEVDEAGSRSGFYIYPNPGSEMVTIAASVGEASGSESLLRCFDQNGRQVLELTIPVNDLLQGKQVDVKAWNPGIYVFVLNLDDRSCTRYFVKQ